MQWTAGQTVGPYVLVAPIGAGGMGEVWKAHDGRLNRSVAIKHLTAEHARRFAEEARAIAALNHPNICQIHDVGPDYLVLEYIEGSPLQGPYPIGEAVHLADQIASALEAAHTKGLVHLDLKPANILVTGNRTVKLLDFGLARTTANVDLDLTQTATDTIAGTAAYMSPEQAQGKPLDARSDVFSFGAVLYEMLSGARAFGEGSIAEVLSAVLRDEPKPLAAPGGLTAVMARCLRKSPGDRFSSASELKAALQQALTADRSTGRPSIVVLPFANMSRDPDDEYFSDGLAEEIINALTKVPGLKVIARTSAFAFKGQNTDIRKIAEALAVTTVLEGSVRRSGNRLRVTAQLIAAADGTHIWSQRYDREMADIFDVQDEIAQAMAGALQVKLDLRSAHTPSLPAYDAFLRGRHHLFKFTPEGWLRAKECFQEAIRLEPVWTHPLTTLGLGYLLAEANGLEKLRETAPRIRALAEQALHIEPAEPSPRFLLGSVAAAHDYDWAEALQQFRASFAAPTTSADARWAWASLYLQPLGRCRQSAAEMRQAVEQDPLNVSYRAILASHLVHARLYDEALLEVHKALDIDRDNFAARLILVEALQARGAVAEAAAAAEEAYDAAPWNGNIVGMYAGLLAQVGHAARAEELMDRLGDADANPFSRVFFHVLRSEIDLAADWYERAIEQRELFALICAPAPLILPLRESARWPRLARLMNLPE